MVPRIHRQAQSSGLPEDHKRVLYQQHDIDATALAIRYAPVKQGIVKKEEHYLHSSANPNNPLEGWQVAVTDRGI